MMNKIGVLLQLEKIIVDKEPISERLIRLNWANHIRRKTFKHLSVKYRGENFNRKFHRMLGRILA